MHKKSRLLVAITLVLVIGLTGITTALATDPEPISQAAITKLLQTPFGTEVPAMDFVFIVEPISFNGAPNVDAASAGLDRSVVSEADNSVTITFDGTQKLIGTENGISTFFLESDGLFNVEGFAKAGFYEYKITEKSNTYQPHNDAEAIVFSEASYTVRVWVIQKDENLEIVFIGVIQTMKDNGDTDGLTDDKMNPTPGGDGEDREHSAMAFTNKYMRINLPEDIEELEKLDPLDPTHSSLFINKEVDGNFASTTQLFDFNITLTVPGLITGFAEGPFTATIVNVGENGELSDTGSTADTREVYAGLTTNFKLSHNQRLVFVDTPVGTSFVVGEAAAPGYEISAAVSGNDSVVTVGPTAMGVGLMLDTSTKDKDGFTIEENLFVGQTGSSVEFLNNMPDNLPMGINMNNLPFIGLIALALGGLVIFVVIKSRKTEDNA